MNYKKEVSIIAQKKENWSKIYDSSIDIASNAKNILSKYVDEFLSSNQSSKIIGIQNRIKSKDSFLEKLVRSNYINTWEYCDNVDENTKTLCSKLPDFIGFRLNTLFHSDEIEFAKILIKFLSEKENINIPPDQQNPNKEQANGHSIKKFQGHISLKDFQIGFEFQIKSSIHNLWGEVEHKSIYKPSTFDFRIEEKKKSVENIWNTLSSSDKQLSLLNKEKYSKSALLQQLFSLYVSELIEITSINSHYLFTLFFNIFIGKNEINLLEKILSDIFLNKKISQKIKYEITVPDKTTITTQLEKIFELILYEKELEQLNNLLRFCFEIPEQMSISNILISKIISEYIPMEDEEEDIDILGFDEDEEEDVDILGFDEDEEPTYTKFAQYENPLSDKELLELLRELGFKIERMPENYE